MHFFRIFFADNIFFIIFAIQKSILKAYGIRIRPNI